MITISNWSGQKAWLQNFFPHVVLGEDKLEYPSVGHAYLAAHFPDDCYREPFRNIALSEKEAWRLFNNTKKQCPLEKAFYRRGNTKRIMEHLLYQKFNDVDMKRKLMDTGKDILEYHSNHHEYFWGLVGVGGKNRLGITIMRIRKEFRDENERQADEAAFEQDMLYLPGVIESILTSFQKGNDTEWVRPYVEALPNPREREIGLNLMDVLVGAQIEIREAKEEVEKVRERVRSFMALGQGDDELGERCGD